VWSVGCLLYELLFGDFLFSDPDWTQFFVRVTKDILPIANDSAAAAMAPYPLVSAFLSYTLVRNPNMRPSISEVVSKFDSMFGHVMEKFSACLPTPVSSSETVAGASSWPVSSPSLLERAAFFHSIVPVHFSSNWSGKLHIGCWPPPSSSASLNFYVVVAPQSMVVEGPACNHMCLSLESVRSLTDASPGNVAALRSLLRPCFDALLACLSQGGGCAICSVGGAGCPDVVIVAASLLCSQGASLLQALRLLRQSVVIETPPPAALDLVHAAFHSR
jgi:serine/threonine protein kinase